MSINYSKKYPKIDNLLCTYFDQDWDDYYQSPEEVINYYIRSNKRKWILDAIHELKNLLQEEHTKEEWFYIIYNDFDCYYNPGHDGTHPKEWLEKVLKQFEVELPLAKDD